MTPSAVRFTNRLAGETSPYLLQHAHNPVDWWPWSPEAFTRAKLLDRPVFLSIGYAACHWCHVMERESFEDPTTAAEMNARFIAIKVDREERPDLDQLYMGAVQAMTGGGGWPMSVFLTPDGRPFYGGTYFPAEPRHGLPSFRQVLDGVARAWRDDRAGIDAASGRLVAALTEATATSTATALPSAATLDRASAAIEAQFDATHGGWGSAPKFPQPMTIEFLLRRHLATGDVRPLAIARRSLDAMADGGIHDQIGGGFHRYATDATWLVPHFEKMLYDNAQLARVYAHAAALTGDPRYAAVARDTLGYLLRDLRTNDGAFAASHDADTEGEEGRTFVWTADEVTDVLGPDAPLFADAYGVTPGGNWEGRTILSRLRTDEDLAAAHGIASSAVESRLAEARSRLAERRAARAQPARDDKVLAAWNGLAIGALADAARLLHEPDYARAAETAAETVLGGLLSDGRLRRSWKDGRATADGVLEDYADLGEGLLALYEATWDERWFTTGRDLLETVLARFADPNGGFYDTRDDAERLVTRPKDIQDNAVPSGNAMAATALLRLAALTGEGRYRTAAERAIATAGAYLDRYPTGFAQWLIALDFAHADVVEVAIVGDRGDPGTRSLRDVLDARYEPNRVSAGSADVAGSGIPLLEGRVTRDGRPTAYVCRGFTCRMPVTTAEELAAELADRAA